MRKTKVNKRKNKYSRKTIKNNKTRKNNKKHITDEVLRIRGLIKQSIN